MNQHPPQYSIADITASLAQRGWRPPAAAGIAANVYRESRGNSAAIGDNGTSAGYFQHHGPRAQALQQFASANGRHWSDPSAQLAFLSREISPQLQQQLNAQTDPGAAARLFMSQYERPANQQVEGPQRAGIARQLMSVFSRMSPVSEAQAAEPGQTMSLEDAAAHYLGSRNPGQAQPPLTPPTGGTDTPQVLSLEDAAAHYLSTLPAPAAAPAVAQSDDVRTLQGPQPAPAEITAALPPAPGILGELGFASTPSPVSMENLSKGAGAMMNTYSAAAQGVTSSATQQEPIGVVAVDDGGRTIIDPGQGKSWLAFDPQKHVLFRGPDGQPTAYPRSPQVEEGALGRLGRLLGASMVWGDRTVPPYSGSAPAAPAVAPEAPSAAHWSTRQARDASGRFTKQ